MGVDDQEVLNCAEGVGNIQKEEEEKANSMED
jgi:hypothetical protein